jgi:hypothetical protein
LSVPTSSAFSPAPAARAPRGATRLRELVKKIETSDTTRKRKQRARKKITHVFKELRRIAAAAGLRAVTLTLTYRDSADFAQRNISNFFKSARQALKRIGFCLPYIWVLEPASRLHYHALLWLPHSYRIDRARLVRWWPWGSHHIAHCRNVGAWKKYITKMDSISFLPKGANLFGYGGLDSVGKATVRRACLPRWLLAVLPASAHARRCVGGGWVDTTTGEVFVSPYIWTPRGILRL